MLVYMKVNPESLKVFQRGKQEKLTNPNLEAGWGKRKARNSILVPQES